MLPSLSLTSSSNSATVKVDKATSELLIAPDWTMNMEICDFVNSDHGHAKEVVKSVKKRLQHKSPRVQHLTLTLLETMVKNCGGQIHYHIAERKILDEMIKIVKKRTDMQVRNKVLVLLDSWQEAFGSGTGSYHTQYFLAYDELRRSGVQFPPRSLEEAPIITPPATTQPSIGHPQIGYGMPNNSSRRLDVAMASDSESLNVSAMESMRSAMELLTDMLQAVNPSDQMSVKDEVIVDVVDRCRTNQKKLAQMLTTTTDEELLCQGLELNDAIQTVLAKHDAISTGSPLPTHFTSSPSSNANDSPTSYIKPTDSVTESSNPATIAKPCTPPVDSMKNPALRVEEEEEEDDEFAQLARRHSKPNPMPARSEDGASSSNSFTPQEPSNALVLADPPAPEMAPKEQDMADFLSIVLSTSYTSEPEPPSQIPNSVPAHSNYTENHVQPTFNSYVAPWSQPQQPPQFQPQQPTSAYPPPPWASTPGYPSAQIPSNNQFMYSTPQETNTAPMPMQGYSTPNAPMNNASLAGRTSQHTNPFPANSNNANGGPPTAVTAPMGQKAYVPAYRLFEDLNVFGSGEGKTKSGPYSSSSGNPGQSAVNGR